MANKPQVFERLLGLETEYALSVRADGERNDPLPSRMEAFERVLAALSLRIPTVRAHHFKEGAFLATGGAVWFEADRLTDNAGLIEGSTPECRGVRETLAYQRAQDRLLERAALEASHGCTIRLLKNDRDAHGNVYGAQENYSVEIARSWRLLAWRCALILLFPLMIFTWLGTLAVFLCALAYELAATGVLVPIGELIGPRGLAATFFHGPDRASSRAFGAPFPAWWESTITWMYRIVATPLAAGLYLLCRWFAYRDLIGKLTPFLVTRPIIAGAGMLDGDGRFLISDKGPAINTLMSLGGFLHDRPIYLLGHFFKAMAAEAIYSPSEYFALFRSQQRLQLGLGDSNMCEAAEFLRVGTTLLVIDCIEAGAMPEPPRLARPIAALRAVCGDDSLTGKIATSQGFCTPLQLQRFYCEACRLFLTRVEEPPAEALQLVRLWEQTLDRLETQPDSLVGTIDWITKRSLLEHAPFASDRDSLRKIALKYHELSPEGYHRILSEHAEGTRILRDEEIDRAQRLPPVRSPASMRGRLLREFAGGDEPIAVNWRMVRIGRGTRAKTYRLADYDPPPAAKSVASDRDEDRTWAGDDDDRA